MRTSPVIVRDPRLVRGGALLMSIALALAVGAAGCSAAPSVDHIEYAGEPSAPQEVTHASEVAWEWEAPEESLLRNVLAGSAGAVMVLGDGVVALDGATGEELWHYRKPDASVASAATTPDGSASRRLSGREREGPRRGRVRRGDR
ncbi:hypothetical protein DFP74_1907 [Nocardiopsis sp. Huas11]|nr:hypothetical protein DFP74_1907 [Nocardiopsis sp. Huas11]